MASRRFVFNVTKGCYVRYQRAEKAIHDACACAWVIEGESIRDLTLAESIAARNVQARLREPLAYAEIPGLKFDKRNPEELSLIWQAHQFAMQIAA